MIHWTGPPPSQSRSAFNLHSVVGILLLVLILSPCRYIPSEKIGQNIDPLQKSFLSLIINTGLVQVYYSHFWAPRTPGGVWGAMGGF